MSENEHGSHAAEGSGDRAAASPGRIIGGRSASPAKRSAADMEDEDEKHAPPSSTKPAPEDLQVEPGKTPGGEQTADLDATMSGVTRTSNGLETQESVTNSIATSTLSSNTSATSFLSEQSGAEGHAQEDKHPTPAGKEPYTTQKVDEQVAKVHQMCSKTLDEGDRGVVISSRWLGRVRSRTSDCLKSAEFSKEAREGNVGPVDNSDIVPADAFDEPILHDAQGSPYIPLKPGLSMGAEIAVVSYDAYGYIIGEYGYASPKPIIRYAHNTAESDANVTNVQYELYPPVITIRKVPQPNAEQAPKSKPDAALQQLRQKSAQRSRGQSGPDDAARLVSSRQERFQKFLARAKEAAGIPLSTKVKVWRQVDPTDVSVDRPDNKATGVISPPSSRNNSPVKPPQVQLIVDTDTFSKMEIGTNLEHIDVQDQTNNDKYDGKSFTMQVASLFEDNTLILEEQIGGPAGGEFQSDSKKGIGRLLHKKGNNNASKPGSTTASGRTSPAPTGMMTRGRTRKDGRTKGCVGLTNLGNTCYMNSALQCIRSVEELAVFFLSNKYKPEINNDNPLGHHGAMANAYANVLRGIYEGSGGAFSPAEFKRTLGRLQPLFSGYGQQDSQEFLSFLVDALHEDLNRIHKKPYIENPDSDDANVHDPNYIMELGEIYRDNHRKRNDSVAMDLFSGFYKNTMECPVCDKVSVTFDPYSLLTVQLPMDHAFKHVITFVPLNGQPVNHEIDIDKNTSIKSLKEHIARKHDGVDANRLWVVEVYSHKIYKIFEDQVTLGEANIQANDYIFMYELEVAPKNIPQPKKNSYTYTSFLNKEDSLPPEGMESPMADVFAVPVFSRTSHGSSFSPALHPLYITVTREEAKEYDIILKKVLIAVSNITSRPILGEFDEEAASPSADMKTSDDGEASKEQAGSEDAGVSDHSAQSEDGYVNVSLDRSTPAESKVNGASPMDVDKAGSRIPTGFMDSQYFLSPALRNQLFEVKVAESSDGIHCASMSSYRDNGMVTMFDRVTRPSRRGSMQSSASEVSTTSAGTQATGESDSDAPDIKIGGEQPLSVESVQDSSDELDGPTTTSTHFAPPRAGRRKKNSKRRGKKGKRGTGLVTYGRNGGGRFTQNRYGLGSPPKQDEDSPYYIQLGEAIVLDWRPEAYDSILGGRADDPNEMRGHRIMSDTGRDAPVFPDKELEERKKVREVRKKNGIDLEACFEETGKREVLSEDNAWYCNRCKELRQALKTLEIWTIPDILVVHMKRFGGSRSFRDKIDVAVDYPIEGLDMSDKVGVKEEGKEYIYDLFAVDNHFGGLGGGHYTAAAKNFNDGEWYDYNDSICHKLSQPPARSAAAYLLFYRRRSKDPLGPQYLQDLVNAYRNPPAEEETEEDGPSGEGMLGGPVHSSQHHNGSSSVLAGAGVGAMNNMGGANGSTGAVGRSQMQSRTTTNDTGLGENKIEGRYDQDNWSFSRLGSGGAAGDSDDADSIKVEMDDDRDSGLGMDDSGARSSPVDESMGYDESTGALHFENSTQIDDPPAQDIRLSDPRAQDREDELSHDHMD